MICFVLAAALAVPSICRAVDPPPAIGLEEGANAGRLSARFDAAIAKRAKGNEDEHLALSEQVNDYLPWMERLMRARPGPEREALLAQISSKIPRMAEVVSIVDEVMRLAPPRRESTRTRGAGGAAPAPDGAGVLDQPQTLGVIGGGARKTAADLNVELDPNNPQARFSRAATYFRLGDSQTAYDETSKALELGKRDSETLTLNAQAAGVLGDYERAHLMAAEALALDPANKTAGIIHALTTNRTSNRSLGKTAAGLAAGSGASAAEAEGERLGGAAQSQVTAAEFAAVASQKTGVPASSERQSAALTRDAQSFLKVQDYQAAQTVASQAIDLNPNNAQAWTYRAVANGYLNKLPEAVYDASYALKLVPRSAPALQTRSWAFNKQKLYKESLADATATIEQDPGSGEAYFNASWAYAGLGKREAALSALKLAAERSPRFAPFYQAAVQAPESADLLLLFQDQAAPISAPAGAPSSRRRALSFIFLSLTGGLLTALAILHLVSARWREKVNATVRRVLGGAVEAAPSASGAPLDLAGGAQPAAQGIWAQYAPVRTLGQGGMGIVYEALDRSLERTVAIKKMREEIRSDPGERQRFISEARMVAGLRHPNLVEIYSIVEDAQDVYLVFEYVPGRTLAERLAEGPLDLREARRVLGGACAAVEHAHKHNVIHRDLKPSNIMLGEQGEPKVMDFGVARQAKDAVTKMALTNTIVGTPPYMAPEQEQGSVRKESDVFALGVCFYEMLTGELPFAGHGAGMLLNKINGRRATLAQKARAPIPPGLEEALAKALAGDPDKRYRTPAEFLAAVDGCLAAKAA